MEKRSALFLALIACFLVLSGAFIVVSNDSSPATEGDLNKSALSVKLEKMRAAEADYPCRLLVLGNADLDDDLDESDLAAVQNLIDNGYSYVNDYMADANYDGIIDKEDLAYLQKLIDFEDIVVYYFNVDYQIASYNKAYPLNLANTLTQTLEMECILCAGNIVATDERCYKGGSMGNFYTEFEAVLDYSQLSNIGSHKGPDVENIASIAKKNGGYLTIWMNSQYTYNTGYIDNAFDGTTVQIVRLPSWEKASTICGLLTAGYLFDKDGVNTAWNRANAFTSWYDGIDSQIKTKAASLSDSEKKKVISASYSSSGDSLFINGSLAGEHMNVARIGIIDVTESYFKDAGISGTWYASLSKEEVTAFYQKYGIDLVVGTIAAPYNADMDDLIRWYNTYQPLISTLPGTEQVTSGWIIGCGPSELIFCTIVGKIAYPELYADLNLEKITNEFLQFLGTYGDGEKQWNYEKLDLLYTGDA